MKFNIETIQKIEKILVTELAQQIGTEEIKAEELEQALRNGLQEIGRKSYGKMLSILDQLTGGASHKWNEPSTWSGWSDSLIRRSQSSNPAVIAG